MKKLSYSTKKNLHTFMLNHPYKSDQQIGKEMSLAQSTVSRYRKEMNLFYDMEFVKMTAGMAIQKIQQAMDYWTHQIGKLEDLKNTKKIIIKTNEDGDKYPSEIDLSPGEILAIEQEQAKLHARIVYLGAQGQVREVLKLMRNGDIQGAIN